MNTKLSIISLSLALATGTVSAVTVDDFNSGSFDQPMPFASQTSAGGLGGTRILSSTISAANQGDVRINIAPNSGKMSQSIDSGVTGTSEVIWGGAGGTGFTATDFTDSGASNAVRVFINDTDANAVGNSLSITLTDSGSNSDTQTYTFTAGDGAIFYLDLLLSTFAGVDETQITRVELDLNGGVNDDWDIDIDWIQTACTALSANGTSSSPTNGSCATPPPPPPIKVPFLPPVAMFLAALGLGGIGAWRAFKKSGK